MPKKIKKRTGKSEEELQQQQSQEPSLDPKDPNSPLYDPESPFTAEELAEVETEGASDEDKAEEQAAAGADGAIALRPVPTKPGADAEPDAFELATVHAVGWFDKNKQTLFGGAALILVLAGLTWAVLKVQESRATSASTEINTALSESQVMVEGSSDLKLFEVSEEIKKKPRTYATPKEKWERVYADADKGVKAHAGEPVGRAAQLVQASAALRLGKYDEAITMYEAAAAEPALKPLSPSIHYGLGMAYWGKGEVDKALATFDKLAQQDKSFAPLAIYQKGVALETAGKKAEAKDVYHKLLESHPDTTFKGDVERRLTTL